MEIYNRKDIINLMIDEIVLENYHDTNKIFSELMTGKTAEGLTIVKNNLRASLFEGTSPRAREPSREKNAGAPEQSLEDKVGTLVANIKKLVSPTRGQVNPRQSPSVELPKPAPSAEKNMDARDRQLVGAKTVEPSATVVGITGAAGERKGSASKSRDPEARTTTQTTVDRENLGTSPITRETQFGQPARLTSTQVEPPPHVTPAARPVPVRPVPRLLQPRSETTRTQRPVVPEARPPANPNTGLSKDTTELGVGLRGIKPVEAPAQPRAEPIRQETKFGTRISLEPRYVRPLVPIEKAPESKPVTITTRVKQELPTQRELERGPSILGGTKAPMSPEARDTLDLKAAQAKDRLEHENFKRNETERQVQQRATERKAESNAKKITAAGALGIGAWLANRDGDKTPPDAPEASASPKAGAAILPPPPPRPPMHPDTPEDSRSKGTSTRGLNDGKYERDLLKVLANERPLVKNEDETAKAGSGAQTRSIGKGSGAANEISTQGELPTGTVNTPAPVAGVAPSRTTDDTTKHNSYVSGTRDVHMGTRNNKAAIDARDTGSASNTSSNNPPPYPMGGTYNGPSSAWKYNQGEKTVSIDDKDTKKYVKDTYGKKIRAGAGGYVLAGVQDSYNYQDFKNSVLSEMHYAQNKNLIENKQRHLLHKMQEMVNAQKVKELRDAELEDIKVDTKRDARGNPIKTDITGVPSVHVTAKPVVSYDPRTNIATSARQPGGPLVQNLRAFNTSINKYDYRHPNLEESAKKQNQYSHDDLKTLTKHFNHFTDIAGSGQGDFLSNTQKVHFQAHARKINSLPHELQTQLYTLIKDHVNDKSNHYEEEDKSYLQKIYKPESLIKIKEDQHYCAKHVFSELYGEGVVVEGAHAEPDEDGNVQWYTVEFAHGPEQVYTEDVEIMIAEYHNNHTQSRNTKKKQKKVM